VVVYVLIVPDSEVVDVYVEPVLSVVTIITGMIPNWLLEVDMDVTVEPEPDMVVVFHSVNG